MYFSEFFSAFNFDCFPMFISIASFSDILNLEGIGLESPVICWLIEGKTKLQAGRVKGL